MIAVTRWKGELVVNVKPILFKDWIYFIRSFWESLLSRIIVLAWNMDELCLRFSVLIIQFLYFFAYNFLTEQKKGSKFLRSYLTWPLQISTPSLKCPLYLLSCIKVGHFHSFRHTTHTHPFLLTPNNPLGLQTFLDLENLSLLVYPHSFRNMWFLNCHPLSICDGSHCEVSLALLITFDLFVQ